MMFRGFLLLLLGLCACVTPGPPGTEISSRRFDFARDTFSFPNELVWEYVRNPETGKMENKQREPEPDYALHCVAMVRSARQFFYGARFDPTLPKLDRDGYRPLVRQVLKCDPRTPPGRSSRVAFQAASDGGLWPPGASDEAGCLGTGRLEAYPTSTPVVIPGYSDLRQFSAEQESLLKAELGGAWQSYLQRGNWRMVFPFTRRGRAKTAERLAASLHHGYPPIVHLVRFPDLSINHALLLFDAADAPFGIRFLAYDPNSPAAPAILEFHRADRTFQFQANDYFAGGHVDVYEIFRGLCY